MAVQFHKSDLNFPCSSELLRFNEYLQPPDLSVSKQGLKSERYVTRLHSVLGLKKGDLRDNVKLVNQTEADNEQGS